MFKCLEEENYSLLISSISIYVHTWVYLQGGSRNMSVHVKTSMLPNIYSEWIV